jgi:hypothetical protein
MWPVTAKLTKIDLLHRSYTSEYLKKRLVSVGGAIRKAGFAFYDGPENGPPLEVHIQDYDDLGRDRTP